MIHNTFSIGAMFSHIYMTKNKCEQTNPNGIKVMLLMMIMISGMDTNLLLWRQRENMEDSQFTQRGDNDDEKWPNLFMLILMMTRCL